MYVKYDETKHKTILNRVMYHTSIRKVQYLQGRGIKNHIRISSLEADILHCNADTLWKMEETSEKIFNIHTPKL